MKVLVAVKRVIDFNVKIRVKSDATGVETGNTSAVLDGGLDDFMAAALAARKLTFALAIAPRMNWFSSASCESC